jgi:hypothetical protein
VTYFHVELASHDVILAEGLPCESYLDNGSRSAFTNGCMDVQLHPDFGPAERCEAIGEALGYAPLRITGLEVERIRAKLRRRAAGLGHAVAPIRRQSHSAEVVASADLAALLQLDWYLAIYPDVAAAGIDPTLALRPPWPAGGAPTLRGSGIDPRAGPDRPGYGDPHYAGRDRCGDRPSDAFLHVWLAVSSAPQCLLRYGLVCDHI